MPQPPESICAEVLGAPGYCYSFVHGRPSCAGNASINLTRVNQGTALRHSRQTRTTGDSKWSKPLSGMKHRSPKSNFVPYNATMSSSAYALFLLWWLARELHPRVTKHGPTFELCQSRALAISYYFNKIESFLPAQLILPSLKR